MTEAPIHAWNTWRTPTPARNPADYVHLFPRSAADKQRLLTHVPRERGQHRKWIIAERPIRIHLREHTVSYFRRMPDGHVRRITLPATAPQIQALLKIGS